MRRLLSRAPDSSPEAHTDLLEKLTVREKEVLRLVAYGLSNAKIASNLHLGIHTIKNHKSNIIGKFGLNGVRYLYTLADRHRGQLGGDHPEK